MAKLETEFTLAMFDIYRRAKSEAKYNATIFFQIICRSLRQPPKRLIIEEIVQPWTQRPRPQQKPRFDRGGGC